MVLAAGLGTRLRPLTDRCAKPLVPVGDRPALAHILGALRTAGVRRIVVNAHHRAADVRAFAASLADVAVSEERDLLGTAGGVHRAGPLLGAGDVVVWNGDILTDLDPCALVAEHEAGGGTASLVVQPLARGQGAVGIAEDGRVVRLRQERFGEEASGGQFLGIYVLSAELRARLPEVGGMIEDVLVPALARGAVVRAVRFERPWHDIGTVSSYLAANAAWLAARGVSSWTGPGAYVDGGVSLDASVVGAGARVEGTGAVVGSVVWPGARAVAPLADVVVTS
jgi:mannose-1-phosphate guanylyltransferase